MVVNWIVKRVIFATGDTCWTFLNTELQYYTVLKQYLNLFQFSVILWIDSEAVIHMTYAELATFIPLYGDRMAVSGFCRDKKGASKKDKKKKSSLMDKLRSTVNALKGNASRSGDENDEVDDADSSFENSRRKKLKGTKMQKRLLEW